MPAAAAKRRSAKGSGNSRNPPEAPLRDRVAARLQALAAESQSAVLADGASDPELAADTVYNVLAHQFASAHSLAMGLGAQAHCLLRDAARGGEEGGGLAAETLRFAAGAARLMERCRAAALTLDRLGYPELPPPEDGGPPYAERMNPYSWQLVNARQKERRCVIDWLAQGKKAADLPKVEEWPQYHNPRPDIEKFDENRGPGTADQASLHAGQRRGCLKNGNPSGDYLAAPRCGATARAGHACRQPAMANGRCRFHGGKSTGPRTAEGRHRAQTARLTHGFRRAEIIRLRSTAAHVGRDLKRLTRALRPPQSLSQRSTQDSHLPLRERACPGLDPGGQGERGLARGSAPVNPPSAPNSLNAAMEGHLIHSGDIGKDSVPRFRAETPLPYPSPASGEGSFSRPSVTGSTDHTHDPARFVPFVPSWCNLSSPVPAGHGVHRSNLSRAPSPAGQRHAQRQRLRG